MRFRSHFRFQPFRLPSVEDLKRSAAAQQRSLMALEFKRQGLVITEIAKRLSVTPGTVRNYLKRAIQIESDYVSSLPPARVDSSQGPETPRLNDKGKEK